MPPYMTSRCLRMWHLVVTWVERYCDLCVCRHSTEEPMELSEDERNELMKKESSRLLKTGHRVSYSPRKEKALKIYLDGGPAKDLGQDWGAEHHSRLFETSGCCSRATRLRDWVSRPIVTWTSSSAVRLTCSHPPLWAPELAQKPYCAL